MNERRQATFIVRMWSEPGNHGETSWRGSVDEVSSRKRLYFSNLGAMCEFILTERDRRDRAKLVAE